MKTPDIALRGALLLAVTGALAAAAPAMAGYRNIISNDTSLCSSGKGPAVMVTVNGISKSTGKIRIQSYRATDAEWLEKGKWLNRIEAPARAGTMRFCMPVPATGSYGIAVRHDVNNNGKTDIMSDGGAMSNNPSLNIFNLGKPSYKKVAINVGPGVEAISITMRYR